MTELEKVIESANAEKHPLAAIVKMLLRVLNDDGTLTSECDTTLGVGTHKSTLRLLKGLEAVGVLRKEKNLGNEYVWYLSPEWYNRADEIRSQKVPDKKY